MPSPQNRQLTSPPILKPSISFASFWLLSDTQLRIFGARQSGQIGFVMISSQTTQLVAVFSIVFLMLALLGVTSIFRTVELNIFDYFLFDLVVVPSSSMAAVGHAARALRSAAPRSAPRMTGLHERHFDTV